MTTLKSGLYITELRRVMAAINSVKGLREDDRRFEDFYLTTVAEGEARKARINQSDSFLNTWEDQRVVKTGAKFRRRR